MRKWISTVGIIIILVFVGALAFGGLVVLPDFWTSIAVGLFFVVFPLFYWGWTPQITRWFEEKKQPILSIDAAKLEDEEKVTEIQVRTRGGEIRSHEARFHYITVRNSGSRDAEDLEAYYRENRQVFFLPSHGKSIYRVDYDGTAKDFDDEFKREGVQAFVFAVINDERLEDTINIRSGPNGQTFALFFTLKDFRCLIIPGPSRICPNHNEGMPCKIVLPICFTGKHMSDYVATFEVVVEDWKQFTSTQIAIPAIHQVNGASLMELATKRKVTVQ
jgi:hypothetical protein